VSLEESVTALADAVQAFASAQCEDDALVTQAVVVYEVTGFTADGEQWRRITYSVPTDNFSLSGAVGLLDVGLHVVRQDVLSSDDDD
jgi:hypothetical protein